MEGGRASVNFFTINNKRNQQTGLTSGASANTYTKQMEMLDKELEEQGLAIERLSDEQKINYVNSLSDFERQRLSQYKDAGYSFGASKALIDLERQRSQGNGLGGYRSELAEPIGGKESLWNKLNYIGYKTEDLDDWIQNEAVPFLTVNQKEQRTQKLLDKYNSMTDEDRAKLREEYYNDPNAKRFVDDTEQENLDYYWKEKNASFWDEFRGAKDSLKFTDNEEGKRVAQENTFPSLTQAIANAPASALATASAIVRATSNPLDNMAILFKLFGTKEGRDLLYERYIDEEGRNESIEKDPVGWVLDLFDLGSLMTRGTAHITNIVSKGERLVGAKNTANKTKGLANKMFKISSDLDNIADMGLTRVYDRILDNALARLGQGGRLGNLAGNYISMTQRPLQTIWNGAGPSQEYIDRQNKKNQETQQSTPADDRSDETWVNEYTENTGKQAPETLDKGVKWTDNNGVEHKGTRKQMIESLAQDPNVGVHQATPNQASAKGFDENTSYTLDINGTETADGKGREWKTGEKPNSQVISAEEKQYFDRLRNNKSSKPKSTYQYNPGKWAYEGLEKPLSKLWDKTRERIQTTATGLTPEVRERIRQNPFIKKYRDEIKAMIDDEGLPMDNSKIMEQPLEEVGNELLRRLEAYERALEEDGTLYERLFEITRPYDISGFMDDLYKIFDKNGITVTPDGLEFRTTANPGDMNPINIAWNLIKNMEPNFTNMTPKQIWEFRKKLRSLIKYQSDAPATKFAKNVLRQIVDGAYNKEVHKQIPEMKVIDNIYSKGIDQLREYKDNLVYQVGEKKGQIKDNFYSIISTINTPFRKKMKERLERSLFPDLGARVEAIRMLPTIAKAVQTSPQMMKALFQNLGFIGGLKKSGVKAVMGWLLGIVIDELFAKPMGEKWRNQAINELMDEVSPEALQKLAEIKSKVDAGVELSEQEKRDLQTAIQDIAMKENQYLDEKHKKAFDEMMEGLNNPNPALPGTMDTIGSDGKVRLSAGKQVNNPENYTQTPRNRQERVQQIQEEYAVDINTAEEMTNTVEDFLDEIGANIQGEISPREVNYERFSEKTLVDLMNDDRIPQSEKAKIQEVLETKPGKEIAKSEGALDQEFAYRINKLQEEEQRVGKVGKNKVDRSVAKQQQKDLEAKREALKLEMRERYGGTENHDQTRAEDKYAELSGKGIDYINSYKKSKGFREEQAEKKVLEQLKQEWDKEPKFVKNMDDETAKIRKEFLDNAEPKNGYKLETTNYNDRYINEQTGDRGKIVFKKDGKIEVTVSSIEGLKESGLLKYLPDDTEVKISGEEARATAGELRDYEYQTVGRANPNEKTITAEEGLNLKSFKGDKTIEELADEYGLKKQIVDKIFTAEGEEALGRAKGDLIELVKEIKEGTAPHEVFHPIFNMVNSKRRAEIIDLVKKHKGMTEAEAKEWLADSFSEYFRTGKFDTKPIPEGFVNKVKWFFNKVKEFINGTWRSRKKIQKLFDDIMENKIEKQKLEGGEYEYQLGTDEIYEKAERVMERKLDRLLTNKNYSSVALTNAMAHTYDPNFDTWLNKINKYLDEHWNASIRSMLNRRELLDAYTIMQEYASDGVMKFYETAERVNNEDGNKRMSEDYEMLKKMKKNPLQIPEDLKYEPYTYELRQALYDIETPLQYLVESYDSDPLEWINEAEKTRHILSREMPKYEELVNIQNLLDKFIESGGKKVEGTFNDKMMNRLIEKRMNNHSRIGSTFDEKAIREIGGDIESTVQNRISDFTKYRHRANGRGANMPDEAVGDFVYALGNSYDPNIDIWKENMEKELKKMYPNYNPDENPLIWEHQYQTLKSRIEQLGKYDNTDYQMLREDDMSGIFMEGVNDKKTQQIADKSEKATQDLVAVSGLSISNFEKQIKGLEGKSPMPSIGITDPNVPHENRGELTLVFGKDTVDPKANPENVIYGSDAYTPMFPSTRTKGGLDLDDMHRIANKINDKYLGSDVGVRELIVDRISDLKKIDPEDNETREEESIRFRNGFEGEVNSILEERMDEGIEPIELEDKEIHEIWEEMITPILENQPRTVIPASYFINGGGYKDPQKGIEVVDKLTELIPDEILQETIDNNIGTQLGRESKIETKEDAKRVNKAYMLSKLSDFVNDVEELNIPLDVTAQNMLDFLKDEIGLEGPEVEKLVNNLFQSDGDREYTAENALEAMKLQRSTNRNTQPGSYRDMIQAEGTEINDLEDVRKKNFGKMVHDEYLGNIEYLEDRYDQLINIIGDEYMGYPDDGLYHHGERRDEVREMIKDAYDTDIEKFKENLPDISKEDGTVEQLKLPDDILQRIIDVVEQGKKVPIRFSESKPQRVVDLYEEVKYVLVPERDVERVNKMVAGTPLEGKVEGYKTDDVSAPRSRKIKELQKKYGNIFFSFGGAVMPIVMLLMMAQGGDDQGEGQQA